MPSLLAFRRKWNIASDDFVFPEITEALVRLSWVIFGFSVVVFHFPLSCSTQNVTPHILALLLINVITIFLAIATAIVSARGAIMDSAPRKLVPPLLYIRLPVFIIEIFWAFVSTVHAFRSVGVDDGCHFSTLVRVTIVLEWALIGAVFIGVVIVFHISDDDIGDSAITTRRTWSRRFRILKIGQDSLVRAAIDDIATLIASFFVNSDLVLSDVIAGLLLLYHSPSNTYPPVTVLRNPEKPTWMTLENANYFLHYATSVYGWPSFVMHNCAVQPLWKLYRRLQFCGRPNCEQENAMVIEDNCCLCNTAAMTLSLEGRNADIFFISFRNRLYEVPFAVLADHDKKCIVATLRGSCSLIDLVTDLCLDDELMSVNVDADATLRQDPELDEEGEVRVHRGMLRGARIVFDILRKNKILEDLFLMYPNYELIICGHSLGAGVASLLTILLKQKYPHVKCYAFSPPGCVISEHGQPEMERYVMSVVTGDDIVSRMSYQALHRLRVKVFKELRACTTAKYKILIKGMFKLFFQSPWRAIRALRTDRDTLIRTHSQTYGSSDAVEVEDPIDLDTFDSRVQLYVPGRILFVSEEKQKMTQKWIDAKCLNDIKLSVSAVSDHIPINVAKMFERALNSEEPTHTSVVVEETSSIRLQSVQSTQPVPSTLAL